MTIIPRILLVIAAPVVLSVGTANAGILQLTNWWAFGGRASVNAKYWDGSRTKVESVYCGVGSFAARYDGVDVSGPLYCLDVFHSFSSLGQAWDNITPQVIPSDPSGPPPWNTPEATWAYRKYAYTTDGTKAAGVQLALWEISHEQNWRANYTSGGWNVAKSGSGTGYSDFSTGVALNSGMGQYATTILNDVRDNFTGGEYLLYYNPGAGSTRDYTGKQGMIGDIPEPTGLVLLGFVLLSGAGLSWRKRSRRNSR